MAGVPGDGEFGEQRKSSFADHRPQRQSRERLGRQLAGLASDCAARSASSADSFAMAGSVAGTAVHAAVCILSGSEWVIVHPR